MKNNSKLTEFLLSKEADTNLADEKGQTPLHLSVLLKDIKTTALLIDNGAKIDAIDKNGKTPLDLSVQNKDTKMFKFLILSGAKTEQTETNIKQELAQTPLYQMNEILENKEQFITSQTLPLIQLQQLETQMERS